MKIPKKQKGLVFLVIIAASLALIHLYIQNININLKRQYLKYKIKYQDVYEENRLLKSQVAERSSLTRIERIAREDLGMIYSEEIKYVIVTPEGKN